MRRDRVPRKPRSTPSRPQASEVSAHSREPCEVRQLTFDPGAFVLAGQVHYATGRIGHLSFVYSTGVSSVSFFYAAMRKVQMVRSVDGARERSRATQKTEIETLAARSLQLDLSTGCSRFREVRWSRRSRRFSNRPSTRSKNLPPRIPPIFSIPPDLIKARDSP